VPGFNCLERAAENGYEAFALSYEGSGGSSFPSDGTTIQLPQMVEDAAAAVEWIRASTGAERVDLFGSSVGSFVAMELGSDPSPVGIDHIGGLVLTGVIYEEPSAGGAPLLAQLVASAQDDATNPTGYFVTTPADYAPLFASSDPRVAAWGMAALPGDYALGPLLCSSHLPVFDASLATAPALQVWGDHDPLTPEADVELFQSTYRGPIALYVVEGGGHVPYYEPKADDVWRVAFDFLDSVHDAKPDTNIGAAWAETRLRRR
jgi:pimeloyl-ACP methyl ester carboxylesterase